MNVRITIVALVLLAAAMLAAAQDPTRPAGPAEAERVLSPELVARYERMAAELKKDVPLDEIKFSTVPAVQTKLFRADPKLLENKFVAQFELSRRTQSIRGAVGNEGSYREVVQSLQMFDRPSREQFKMLLEKCPAPLRPEMRMIHFLTSDDFDRDVRHFAMSGSGVAQIELTFAVFAPTAEEAQGRARAIVQLYAGGFWRPVQQAAFEEGQQALEKARKIYEDLPKLSAALAAEQARLAKPSEISDDILTQLKAQKVMQTVELAGLNARVKACDAILGDPKRLEISTLQSINDMKVKAEIERVGIKEKLDQINAFIAEGNERQAAWSRQVQLNEQRASLLRDVALFERMAALRADLYDHFRPLPDDPIAIGPVEWVSE